MPDHLSSPIKNGGRKWTGDETRARGQSRHLLEQKMATVKLQSSDGEVFEAEADVAKVSVTIKNMLDGEGDESVAVDRFI